MDQLRKIIQEAVAKVIEEDFASTQEIQELANQALIIAANQNKDYVLRQVGDEKIRFYPVKLLEVYQDNPKKYPTLQDFITNTNVVILFSFVRNSKTAGHYAWSDEKEYDNTRTRFITLIYDDKLVDDLKEKISDRQKRDMEFESSDLYFSFWYKFHSTLEHEIQHAYDDFRSKSKLFRAKRFNKYREKYHLPSGAEIPIDDPKLSNTRHLEYLKLQHEIEARFTQAVSKTRFTSADFKVSPEGVDYVHYEMKPLKDVLRAFTYDFEGWRAMSDKVKRNLIRRVSQYWHKKQESLPEKNAQSLNKEKEVLNKKEALSELFKLTNHIKNAIQNKR